VVGRGWGATIAIDLRLPWQPFDPKLRARQIGHSLYVTD